MAVNKTKMEEISVERQKENKVMAWWIKKLPQTKAIFDMMTDGYKSTESVGIYILIGSLVLDFYHKPLEKHNSEELKKFLELYNQFLQEFKGIFLENIDKWIPENAEIQDYVIAMVSTEICEGTNPKDYDYVLSLMPEGMMKEESKNFVLVESKNQQDNKSLWKKDAIICQFML